MPASSSVEAARGPDAFRVATFSVAWPVERLTMQVRVAGVRRPTALERAVQHILVAFGDAAPTTAEAVAELGLGDAAFLEHAMRALLEDGTVACVPTPAGAEAPPSGSDGTPDLSTLRLSARGRELFRRDRVPTKPATHGLKVELDTLTDEVRRSGQARTADQPAHGATPAVAPDRLPPLRATLGHDRVLTLARDWREPWARGEVEVQNVAVAADGPSRGWQQVEVAVELCQDGTLAMRTQGTGASSARDAWLEQRGAALLLGLPVVAPERSREAATVAELLAHAAGPFSGNGDLSRLRAARELVLAGPDAAALEKALAPEPGRGPRTVFRLFEAEREARAWREDGVATTALVAEAGGFTAGLPGTVAVADGADGRWLVKVTAHLPDGRPVTVAIDARLATEEGRRLRQQARGVAPSLMQSGTEAASWAALALDPSAESARAVARAISERTSGLERVERLAEAELGAAPLRSPEARNVLMLEARAAWMDVRSVVDADTRERMDRRLGLGRTAAKRPRKRGRKGGRR